MTRGGEETLAGYTVCWGDKIFEMLLIKTVRDFLSYFGNPMSGFF